MVFCLRITFALLLLSIAPISIAQSSPDKLWTDITPGEFVSASEGSPVLEPNVDPIQSRFTRLDVEAIKQVLDRTTLEEPTASSQANRPEPVTLFLPTPEGGYEEFEIWETGLMAPELAAKFPGIKTYAGTSISDASTKLKFDLTPAGFHAQVLAPGKRWYIDPRFKQNAKIYASYFKEDTAGESHSCLLEEAQSDSPQSSPLAAARSGNELLVYRLAVATTGEYGDFHGGTTETALAAVVTTINRVNGIYEKELAIRLVLIAENDSIIYTDPATDPFMGNNDAGILIDESQDHINTAIGSTNYDVGHTLSTGAGGLAALGAICFDDAKAAGVTGSSNPAGDPFDVDFVAHEIGHQFGGNHTFNGDVGSCGGFNRSGSHAYEPGSGSTIQAYAGICGSDNLQSNSDPIFHSESHAQIIAYVTTGFGATCAMPSTLSNAIPDADAGADFTIPKQTPFALTGTATDTDAGDVLTYLWEQRDLGPQAPLNAPDDGQIPLFRVLTPSTSPTRYLPKLETLSNNLSDLSEKLPTLPRVMNWRLSVRDNEGGVDSDDTQITVDELSGPFLVTSPNGGENVSGTTTVTWDVAGTNAGLVAAANVDIYLSQDSGLTFDPDNPLVTSVTNDGSHTVLMPNIATSTARIMIKGTNSIFFDTSDQDFSIEPSGTLFELHNDVWQIISLPAVPPADANTVADIFGDDIDGDYTQTWQVFEYNPIINMYNDVGLEGVLEPGVGYWIIQNSSPTAFIDMPVGSTPTPTTPGDACTSVGGCLSIALGGGISDWKMIGNPFFSTPDTSTFRVTSSVPPCNANLGCTLTEASAAPDGANIIQDHFYWWNGGPDYETLAVGESFGDWRGYWARIFPDATTGDAMLRVPRSNIGPPPPP